MRWSHGACVLCGAAMAVVACGDDATTGTPDAGTSTGSSGSSRSSGSTATNDSGGASNIVGEAASCGQDRGTCATGLVCCTGPGGSEQSQCAKTCLRSDRSVKEG